MVRLRVETVVIRKHPVLSRDGDLQLHLGTSGDLEEGISGALDGGAGTAGGEALSFSLWDSLALL